jgi:hypothetical protein
MSTFGPAELKNLIRLDAVVEEHRNLFCPSYDGCLDEVVAKGWTSWTCARCPLFAVHTQADVVSASSQRHAL